LFAHSPKIVTDGLVLSLDAGNTKSYPGTGTTWFDKSGYGNNGTLTNGPTFNTGSLGSIVFDGVDDYVNCGNISTTILSNNQFTANYWFRMTGTARGDLFNIKNFNTPQDDIGFFIDISNKLNAYFAVQGVITNNSVGPGYASISNTSFSRNTIYNIAFGKDSSQKIFMYINGVLDNNTYSTVTNTANVAVTPFWIGSNKTDPTTPAQPFAGNIYLTQIYNRALTPSEVLQNYNATKGRFGL
jgi:hypothetical protein